MKCIKNEKTGTIIRVDDKQAEQMVGSTWKYASKSEWKNLVRDVKVEEISEKKQNPKQSADGVDEAKPFTKTRKKSK